MERMVGLKQAILEERFPIWISSIPWECFTDPLNLPALKDYVAAHPIAMRSFDWQGGNGINHFLSSCCAEWSFGRMMDGVESVLQLGSIVSDNNAKYKIWAGELYQDKVILRLMERNDPKMHNEWLKFNWSKDSVLGLELIMRPGESPLEIERIVSLIQASDEALLGQKVILVEYTEELGYRIDTYYPKTQPPHWINLQALAMNETRIEVGYAWK